MGIEENLSAGRAALDEGRWRDAVRAFEASLAESETTEALDGLGEAFWWLCEARASVGYRERAYVSFRRAGDVTRACMSAVNLSITYLLNLGNTAAARGWLARSERLMGDAEPNPARGWVCLMQGFLSADPNESPRFLRRALDIARETGDVDLELVALSDLGLTLVSAGESDEGLALLDEAMAGTLGGEYARRETVVYTSCNMLQACNVLGDLERASQWCRVADNFMRDYSSPFLFARCRVHYGSVLVAKGQWSRAEGELQAALQMSEDAGPGPREEALVRLTELRLRQGRLEEARALLDLSQDPSAAYVPRAALRLAGGDPSAAVALLVRHLESIGENHPETVSALAMLVDAQIASGDLVAAKETAKRLAEVAAGRTGGHSEALALLASGHLASAVDDTDEAIPLLEKALEQFSHLDLPLEAARVRLDLARALAVHAGEPAAAEARAALVAFEQLGATRDADAAAALLRDLGESGRTAHRHVGVLTNREQEVLALVALGLSNPEIAQRLYISRKTAAHHVSNLLSKLGLRNRAEAVAYAATASTTAEKSPNPRAN